MSQTVNLRGWTASRTWAPMSPRTAESQPTSGRRQRWLAHPSGGQTAFGGLIISTERSKSLFTKAYSSPYCLMDTRHGNVRRERGKEERLLPDKMSKEDHLGQMATAHIKPDCRLQMAETSNICGEIKRRRWNWIGHIVRKDPAEDFAVALGWAPEGRRKGNAKRQHGDGWWRQKETRRDGTRGTQHAERLQTATCRRQMFMLYVHPGTERIKVKVRF